MGRPWTANGTRGALTQVVENSFFKTLIDHQVTVELKNDIQLRGTLKSVDQYLNIKLDDISVVEELKYPHLVSAPPKDCRSRPSRSFLLPALSAGRC